MITLELAIHDALHRIRNAYDASEGKLYCSFSGGKDSTIVAELIKMAELPENIPLVFANTGIELEATTRFVQNYDYPNIVIVKPEKPMVQILKEFGYPVINKQRSELLGTFLRNNRNPDSTARARQLIYGYQEKAGVVLDKTTNARLANKHMHFAHPDLEYSVANKCCQYMKKKPFIRYALSNDRKHALTGIRVAEGGIRAIQYKSCTVTAGKQTITMPIIDWSDEICDEFIAKYNVKLSDAYEVYGMARSGCIACPYGRNVKEELEILYNHEPLRYKAAMTFFGKVYLDTGVELPFDAEYTAKYEARKPIIEARRLEMLRKYRPDTKELPENKRLK